LALRRDFVTVRFRGGTAGKPDLVSQQVRAAIIAAALFAGAFVFWTYYPHDNLPSPLNTMPTSAK